MQRPQFGPIEMSNAVKKPKEVWAIRELDFLGSIEHMRNFAIDLATSLKDRETRYRCSRLLTGIRRPIDQQFVVDFLLDPGR